MYINQIREHKINHHELLLGKWTISYIIIVTVYASLLLLLFLLIFFLLLVFLRDDIIEEAEIMLGKEVVHSLPYCYKGKDL